MLNSSEDREKCLLNKVAYGNEIAFAELFHIYRPKLYSFVYRISGSKLVAEDVVQDVFIKIWQMRADLIQIQNFNAYLFRMAHNHFLNSIKRMAKETLILSEIARKSAGAEENIFGQIDFKELEQLFQFAIEELPQRQKMVFLLSKEQGMKQEEISKQLNISVITVKSHLTEAFRSIRKKIKGVYPVISVYLSFALLNLCFQ